MMNFRYRNKILIAIKQLNKIALYQMIIAIIWKTVIRVIIKVNYKKI